MPYCSQCGKTVSDTDAFCAACGGRQGEAALPKAATGIDARTASMLCYIPVIGWVPAIVVLASERFRQDRQVRFHAFQGLYLFVAWLIVEWGLGPFFSFGHTSVRGWSLEGILKAVLYVAWVFMILKTAQRIDYRLPVLGELAERSLSEQR